MKVCTKCGKEKDILDFNKYKRSKDGVRSNCKKCQSIEGVKYSRNRRANDEEYRILGNLKCKEYKKNHREDISEYNKQYRNNNRTEIYIYNKDYTTNHKENINKNRRIRYQNNKGTISLKRIEKYNQNPEKFLEYKRRRKARIKGGGEYKISPLVLDLILAVQQFKCVYCETEFSENVKKTLDHVTPLIKGGLHRSDNLVYACRSCNCSKNSGPPLRIVQTILPFIN